MLSRRSVFKGAAALATAMGFGTKASMSAVAAPVTMVESAVPKAIKHPWKWRVSLDGGEIFGEEFDTREEAIKEAKGYDGALIAECCTQDYYLTLDGYEILELLRESNEANSMLGDDGEFISATEKQTLDLAAHVERAVNAEIRDWVDRHRIDTTAWTFGAVRNQEKITA